MSFIDGNTTCLDKPPSHVVIYFNGKRDTNRGGILYRYDDIADIQNNKLYTRISLFIYIHIVRVIGICVYLSINIKPHIGCHRFQNFKRALPRTS